MSQQDDDNTFDVLVFMKRLERIAGYRLRKLRCLNDNECGHDVVIDLLPKHSTYIDDKVRLDHPQAEKQVPFLYSSLRFAVLNKKRGCKHCNSETIPIIDESNRDDDDRGPKCSSPVDPQTPEGLCSQLEVIEKVLLRIKNVDRRSAFRKRILDNYSYHEIAEELGVGESLVRKWVERDIKFLRKEFPTLESLWRNPDTDFPGLLT